MTTRRIDHISQIAEISSINGVSLAEVERRAKPFLCDVNGEPVSLDPEEIARTPEENDYVVMLKLCRSSGGFLGPSESFKHVLEADWNAVQQLEVTHAAFASALRSIVQQSGPVDRTVYRFVARLTFSPSAGEQIFHVLRLQTRGSLQACLFTNIEEDDGSAHWNEEWHITNPALNLEVVVGGSAQHGVIDYIDRFGFYEGGGAENVFRLDPHVLMALLTGQWNERARTVTATKYRALVAAKAARLAEVEREHAAAVAQLASCRRGSDDYDDAEVAVERQAIAKQSLADEVAALRTRLAALST